MSEKKRGNAEHLTPFPKGVSGNPKGRPKGSRDAKTIINEQLERLAKDKNGELILDDDGEPMTWGELMHATQIKNAALSGDIAAFNAIMDRAEGKPKQTIDSNNTNTNINHDTWAKDANKAAKEAKATIPPEVPSAAVIEKSKENALPTNIN